ncbi:uncharacterized protein LOC120135693 [Hibiscus syriacus]|uniref:uncharacterized protein LOC120135693 n=1 Tax=Hibiscus syriacus TaxID=106335 RepID=UPI00192181DD|nr:uncharacterized protein LOC120135693 [Hibiscus syriacus]
MAKEPGGQLTKNIGVDPPGQILNEENMEIKHNANGNNTEDIYASPHATKRKEIWCLLNALNPRKGEAWLLEGDFNSIIQSDEKEGGSNRGTGVSKMFQGFIFESELLEVEFRGDEYTWRRGRLWKRLDRCLLNEGCANLFLMSLVTHLARVGSDHCPLLFHAPKLSGRAEDRPFRFIAAWQEHPNFSDFVRESWEDRLNVLANIEKIKLKVRDKTSVFGNIGKRKKILLARLRGIDKALRRFHSNHLIQLETT